MVAPCTRWIVTKILLITLALLLTLIETLADVLSALHFLASGTVLDVKKQLLRLIDGTERTLFLIAGE